MLVDRLIIKAFNGTGRRITNVERSLMGRSIYTDTDSVPYDLYSSYSDVISQSEHREPPH